MTNVQDATLARFAAIVASLGLSAMPVAAFADTFNGTSGDDNIRGTNGDDEIFTGAGSDTVKGRGGDDYIEDIVTVGEENSENFLSGGNGDDEIIGQGDEAEYTAYGNNGDDKITLAGILTLIAYGGRGDDTFVGEDEFVQSTFTGDAGADDFQCGPGHDIVTDYDPEEGDTVSDDCEEVNS